MVEGERSEVNASFPGETVRSTLERYCRRNAVSAKCLLENIVQRRKIRLHAGLPCFLECLEAAGFGECQRLLHHNTLFPLYSCFLSDVRSSALQNAMRAQWPQKVAQAAGWSANQLQNKHVEKYCPHCIGDDIGQHGVAYWHREHQIPAVSACWKHGKKLNSIPLARCGWDQFHKVPIIEKSETADDSSVEFAIFAAKLLSHLTSVKRCENLSEIYRVKLAHHNLLTACGRVRRKEFRLYLGALLIPRSSSEILEKTRPSFRNYLELLHPERCYTQHLITHLYFVSTFFDGPGLLTVRKLKRNRIDLNHKAKYKKSQLPLDCLAAGMSLNKVSKLTGRSRTYLKREAKLNEIPICESPRILTPSRRNRIIGMSREGRSSVEIAASLKIAAHLVHTVISETPELKEQRSAVQFRNKRVDIRRRFLAIIDNHPYADRKHIRTILPNEYHWLYLNDRHWLNSVAPAPEPCVPPTRVDWGQRDEKLFMAALALIQKGWQADSWYAADKAFGGHGWLVKKRVKLPKTVAILSEKLDIQ